MAAMALVLVATAAFERQLVEDLQLGVLLGVHKVKVVAFFAAVV